MSKSVSNAFISRKEKASTSGTQYCIPNPTMEMEKIRRYSPRDESLLPSGNGHAKSFELEVASTLPLSRFHVKGSSSVPTFIHVCKCSATLMLCLRNHE